MSSPTGQPPRSSSDWRSEFPAHDLGVFEWDVNADSWVWTPEMYHLHGYRDGEIEPKLDLVLGHKVAEDRRRAERILGHAATPGFRFRNLHHIIDAHGRRREVLSVGSTGPGPRDDGSTVHVSRGYMLDLTGWGRDRLRFALDIAPTAVAPSPRFDVRDAGSSLSDREATVLELIAAGRTNAEIARQLFLSLHTVKTYTRTVYRKIGVTRRSQAVAWVFEHR